MSEQADSKITMLLGVVILIVVAAALYPLVGEKVDNLSNATHEDYVGSDTESIVDMIPLFYWLAIVLTVIGVAIVAIKQAF